MSQAVKFYVTLHLPPCPPLPHPDHQPDGRVSQALGLSTMLRTQSHSQRQGRDRERDRDR